MGGVGVVWSVEAEEALRSVLLLLRMVCCVSDDPSQDRLFTAVLVKGTDEAGDAWIASGPQGVERLRRELTGQQHLQIPEGVHQRDVLDNLAHASRLVASAYPDEFLAAFPSPQWDDNSFVCAGLGGIRRPEVTKRLMRLLGHEDRWVRIQAAVALGGHQHRGLQSALLDALDDPDDLVRYHVEERLAELDA